MPSDNNVIAVVGAGVAGLLAAVHAAELGAKVHLFEKMDRIGLKMGITGKGRCNLTNSAPIADFIGKTPGNGKFLYSAYRNFSNADLLDLLHSWGMETVTERGGRVFPKSEDAQDVRRLFLRKLEETGVVLHLSDPVHRIVTKGGRVAAVETARGRLAVRACLIATGGKSYPRTGSTGDGYRMAEALGHTVTKLRPALIPLVCANAYCKELQGLSLRNVTLSLSAGGRRKASMQGEMIFTHFGVSGPIVLSLSDQASLWLSQGHAVTGEINLKPALSEEVLDKRILRDLAKFHLKQMRNALAELLPHRLIDVILHMSDIAPDLPVSELTRQQRANLRYAVQHMPLAVTGTRPIEEAIVTAGGVSVKEIQSSTMESKLVPGLYFAGEVMDVHAFTGGYNLQAAFSTGWTAAEHMVRALSESVPSL